MQFQSIRAGLAALAALALVACATPPQAPIALQKTTVALKSTRIGIAMTTLPIVDTYLPGAGCLLCIAAASVANSSLTTYAKTLTPEDLPQLKQSLAQLIRQRGAEPVVIEEALKTDALPDAATKGPNVPRKDYSGLAKRYGIDKLLVIDIQQLGFERTYSAYVPTGAPKGMLRGSGSLVDLKTNTFDWYQPLAISRAAEGAWDEPPRFPGLTNAYFQVIELGKDEVLRPFQP